MSNIVGTQLRRPLKIIAILGILALAIYLYIYIYDRVRIVRLNNYYDPKYGYTADARDQYFAQKFPSSSEIKSYLSDATILFSNPPMGNGVLYFDKDHGFLSWHGNNIEAGKWRLSPELQIIRLGDRWRIAIVQTLCMGFFDKPVIAQQDNCRHVETLDSILSRGRGTRREYTKGNIFDLASNKRAPFRLPTSEINTDSLLANRPSGGEK